MKEQRYAIFIKKDKNEHPEYALDDRLNPGDFCYTGDNLKELFYNCSNKLDNMDWYYIYVDYIKIFETDNLNFEELKKKHPEYFI